MLRRFRERAYSFVHETYPLVVGIIAIIALSGILYLLYGVFEQLVYVFWAVYVIVMLVFVSFLLYGAAMYVVAAIFKAAEKIKSKGAKADEYQSSQHLR